MSIKGCEVVNGFERIVVRIYNDVDEFVGEVDVEQKLIVACNLIVLSECVKDGEDSFGVLACSCWMSPVCFRG